MVYITEVQMSGGEGHQHISTVRWKEPGTSKSGEDTRREMVDWIDGGGVARVRDSAGDDVEIVVTDPRPNRIDIYAELVETLGLDRPQPKDSYRVADLMAQVVVGHRLWREATGGPERIVTVKDVEFMQNKGAKQIWLRMFLDKATRLGTEYLRPRSSAMAVSPRMPEWWNRTTSHQTFSIWSRRNRSPTTTAPPTM